MATESFYRLTELDRTSWPDVRDQLLGDAPGTSGEPRSYPGCPQWPLVHGKAGAEAALEKTLQGRHSVQTLTQELPSRLELSRLLQFSHGINAELERGPTPSAGGLQALELFIVNFAAADWLPAGLYHYERSKHTVAQLAKEAERAVWRKSVPSLELIEGGALLWVLVGDGAHVTAKYGARGWRFLLLEAGHLMQNLCLMSHHLGWTTVPLGGFFEHEIARALLLPVDDAVLYVGVCGKPT